MHPFDSPAKADLLDGFSKHYEYTVKDRPLINFNGITLTRDRALKRELVSPNPSFWKICGLNTLFFLPKVTLVFPILIIIMLLFRISLIKLYFSYLSLISNDIMLCSAIFYGCNGSLNLKLPMLINVYLACLLRHYTISTLVFKPFNTVLSLLRMKFAGLVALLAPSFKPQWILLLLLKITVNHYDRLGLFMLVVVVQLSAVQRPKRSVLTVLLPLKLLAIL